MARYLVVDRSTSQPSLAYYEDRECRHELSWSGEPSRAPHWMDDVRQALESWNVSASELSGLVCGLGPGSFSGIRACLSALNGLALPVAIPVYGVASAAAIALRQAGGAALITVVGDARRERLWCVTYRVDETARRVRLLSGALPAQTSDDFQLVSAGELATVVPEGSRVVSPDWSRIEPWLRQAFCAERLVTEPVFPRASDLGALALSDPEARVLEPVPIYLHPAVAEKTAG